MNFKKRMLAKGIFVVMATMMSFACQPEEHLTNTAFINVVEEFLSSKSSTIGWTKESDGTVKLTPENLQKIRTVTELNLNDGSAGKEKLEDLGGIEYFTGLTYLNCGYNNLTTLDVSGCAALTELYCIWNRLTTLDVSGCTALMTLDCNRNNLTTLNVSGCAALTELDCSCNNLTTLNVSGCTALTTLNCNDSNLKTLDVSGCAALTGLYVANSYGYGKLTTLDVSGCTALTTLWCYGNKLWTLDIRPLSRLTSFTCTPQTESDGVTTRQLTLKLTREQKSKFDLQNGKYLKLEVYD